MESYAMVEDGRVTVAFASGTTTRKLEPAGPHVVGIFDCL
jgi:hypothetical protein